MAELSVHIRWMIRRDMPEVLAIEDECFGPHAWDEDEFIQHLRKRNCIAMVAEANVPGQADSIVGFMLYELFPKRLELLNFAVGSAWQRRGVGRQLAHKLILKLSHQRRTWINGWVGDRDLAMHCFLRALGAKAVEVDRDEYRFVYEFCPETAERLAELA